MDILKIEYYREKEVIRYLKISHVTLWRWKKLGILVPKKVKGILFYNINDIERLLR